MRDSDVSLIRDLPLFNDMRPAHFDTLISAALLQRFSKQVTLIHEGERPDFLHIVVEGTVELYAAWEGRETTLDIIRPFSRPLSATRSI
jgi:CRP/FNR family transcriptional activator FtrB